MATNDPVGSDSQGRPVYDAQVNFAVYYNNQRMDTKFHLELMGRLQFGIWEQFIPIIEPLILISRTVREKSI
jgi:hypothetical protein